MSESKVDICIPPDQKEGTHIELGAWLKSVGDRVLKDEPVAELVTDKAVVELPAPVSGVLVEILVEAESEVDPESVLGRIEAAELSELPPGEKDPALEAPKAARPAPRFAADSGMHPAVARFAAAKDIDLSKVKGTGKGGRIRASDLNWSPSTSEGSARPTPAPAIEGRWVRHDPMRRAIARHMKDSLSTAPHVTAVFECDLSSVLAHRAQRKADWAERGIHLTLTAYFVRAMVEGVKVVPEVNSRFHPDGLEMFDQVHVGVGTALEDQGLVVPVLRSAEQLDLETTASRLTDLTERARSQRLSPDDMKGSTVSLSNHGVMGSLFATPIIINQPESAIVGIGKMEQRAKVIGAGAEASIQIRPCTYLSLTIDHRGLDAFHTNRFLSAMVEHLEAY